MLVSIAGVLSACGVAMLVVAARAGVGGWDYVFWQVAGWAVGVWWFVRFRRHRWTSGRPRPNSRPEVLVPGAFAGALLLPTEVWELGIDRALLSEVIRFLCVIIFGMVVLRYEYDRQPGDLPPQKGLWVALALAAVLTCSELLLRSPSCALVVPVVAAVMLRAGGHGRLDAAIPVLVVLPLLYFLVLPQTLLRYQRARESGAVNIARLWAPEGSFATGELTSRRTRATQPFGLHPRVARRVTIASIVATTGFAGASAVSLLFGVIAWVGARRARDAPTRAGRVMVAGMTAVLIVPAAFHIVGCLALLSPDAGSLPFVGYGPGQLVMAWTALAYLAVAEPSDLVQRGKVFT
ncbi:MAG: FtsW/RodA/SpoVE family cell cycle protein [Acidobacteria bacterium]|nr:FtsW/RodA/SpoVE family cell cycle protein [Acidobacteriota bacterium]